MASPIQWTWTWANSGRQWGTGRPGMLQSSTWWLNNSKSDTHHAYYILQPPVSLRSWSRATYTLCAIGMPSFPSVKWNKHLNVHCMGLIWDFSVIMYVITYIRDQAQCRCSENTSISIIPISSIPSTPTEYYSFQVYSWLDINCALGWLLHDGILISSVRCPQITWITSGKGSHRQLVPPTVCDFQ